jgi:hypothetical protein
MDSVNGLTATLGERLGCRAGDLGLRYLVGLPRTRPRDTLVDRCDPCIWHDSGTKLSRRQPATTAGAPTDQARVCLAAPPTCLSHAFRGAIRATGCRAQPQVASRHRVSSASGS